MILRNSLQLLFLLLIVTTAKIILAQIDFNVCGGCISFAIMETDQGYNADCSTLAKDKGTTAKKVIIRSETMYSFLKSSVLSTSRTFWMAEGTDATTEGTWIIPSTGEIQYTNDAVYKFAWMNWAPGEPNDSGGLEDLLCLAGSSFFVNDIAPAYMSFSNSGVMCMYEHPVISSLKISAGNADASRLLFENTEFTRWQLFPAHLPQLEAFHKCEALSVTDPSTGNSVQGFLSVFYHGHEWDIVKAMIADSSDVKYHSSAAGFGVWIGANTSGNTIETRWQQRGTLTDESIRLLQDDGDCVSQTLCTKGNTPTNQAGLAFGINGGEANKMVWNSLEGTRLPYVCSWRFSPNASMRVDNTLMKDLSKAASEDEQKVAKVSLLTVRVHQTWRTGADAQQLCWESKATNEAGDTVRGMLGMFVATDEFLLLKKLMDASKYLSSGNGVSNLALNGWMVGATANTNWGGTISDLKPKLKWNNGGKLSVDATEGYAETVLDSYTVDVFANDGSCPPERQCVGSINNVNDDNNVYLTYRNDIQQFSTFTYTRRRPFVCTYRFPVRIRIHPTTIAEYVPIIMARTQREEYCRKRFIIDPNGFRINGTDESNYAQQGKASMIDVLAPFISDNTGIAGPVFFGPKKSGNQCMWYRRLAKTYEWENCDKEIQFMCYYITKSETVSATLFSNSKSKSLSKTSTESETSSISSSETSTQTETSSQSATSSETSSESQSTTISKSSTQSSSDSVSQSFSQSMSISETKSLSKPTKSDQIDGVTSSLSKSLPTDTQSDPSLTHETMSDGGHRGSPSHSKSYETDTRSDPSGGTHSISQEPTKTYNESHSKSDTHSESNPSISLSDPTDTKTIHMVYKYKLPQAIETLQTVTGLATLLSGTSVALTKAKLDSLDVLSRCGQAETLEDEEPDFMNAPMGWAIGDPPVSYAKGTAVGNIVAAVIGCGILFFCAIIFGLVFKGSWRDGIEIARIPGLLMIPFLILVPASSEAAFVLFFHAHDPVSTLIAVGSCCMMMGINMAITIQLGRLVSSGLLVMRNLPPSPPSKLKTKMESSDCGRKFSRICAYLFTTRIGWVPYVDVTEYLNVVSGKEDPSKKRQSEIASELSKGWGAVFEDFTLPYFPALDAAVAITLGSCAGVAKGPNLPKSTCIIALSFAVTAAFSHFFVLVYYRPCLVRATQWFISIGSGLTLCSACLSFAFYMGREFAYQQITEKVMLSQSLVGVLLMIVGVGWTLMVFIDFVDAVVAGQDLRHLEKTTKEQLALYKGVKESAANSKNNNKKDSGVKKTALEEELGVLISAMRPENEKASATTRVAIRIDEDHQKSPLATAQSTTATPNVRDFEAVQANNNNSRRSRRRNNNNRNFSSSSEEEFEDDLDLVNQYLFSPSSAKSANARKREWEEQKKIARLRKQKTRADDDASAKAMIEYTKRKLQEEEEKQSKLQQHHQTFSAAGNSSNGRSINNNKNQQQNDDAEEEMKTISQQQQSNDNKLVPQFHNKAVSLTQAQKLQEILRKADDKKRRSEEERNLEILKQEEEKIRKEQENIERRKRLNERMQDLPKIEVVVDNDSDQQNGDDDDLAQLLDDDEQLEVDDILSRL